MQKNDMINMLSIGGSDPSSGAGIQNDIKTSMILDAYCFTVITAITSQNTSRYTATLPIPPNTIQDQIKSIMSDFKINVIKIGMLYNSNIINSVHKTLKTTNIPIIVDPVIKSTTNGTLLKKEAISQYKKMIIPLSYIITPNIEEAQILSNIQYQKSKDDSNIKEIASKLIDMGAANVIITGIPKYKNKISDYILETKYTDRYISSKKVVMKNHGGGCTHSTAVAISIAKNSSVIKSAKFAKDFTVKSIINSKKIGAGSVITHQDYKNKINEQLSTAIIKLGKIKNISKAIPECQTNFVFAKTNPKTTSDILGVAGRIVRVGDEITIAGNLEYGGSKHVATAVLTINSKFPKIRCAINIKYNQETLQKLKKEKKLNIKKYDRSLEPQANKAIENRSIQWGIKSAITKNPSSAAAAATPPDVIYHTGDIGKEPMIIVFGKTPQDVINKISGIF